jgi:hypothetical protein
LFATTAQDSSNFGRINYDLDAKPFTIVEANMPNSTIARSFGFEADGMPAVAVPSELLQTENWVTPHNSAVIPNLPIFK